MTMEFPDIAKKWKQCKKYWLKISWQQKFPGRKLMSGIIYKKYVLARHRIVLTEYQGDIQTILSMNQSTDK